MRLITLSPHPDAPFPAPERALHDPEGLLAVGGDLSPQRLLNAYRQGIFPWYGPRQPILWWCPDPRIVFDTGGIHLSARFRRQLRGSTWEIRFDSAFEKVVRTCASIPRRGERGTWITPEMRRAYVELHRLGHAHSAEVFDGERLVGGIYGVAIGRMFFGESMFSGDNGGSKAALAGLARQLRSWGFPLIDAQVSNPHLLSLGAYTLPRAAFLRQVAELCAAPGPEGPWDRQAAPFPARLLAAPEGLTG